MVIVSLNLPYSNKGITSHKPLVATSGINTPTTLLTRRKVTISNYWRRHISLLKTPFSLVGGNFHEHSYDLKPSKLRHTESLVSDPDLISNTWGSLNTQLFRLRRATKKRAKRGDVTDTATQCVENLPTLSNTPSSYISRQGVSTYNRWRVTLIKKYINDGVRIERWATYRNNSFTKLVHSPLPILNSVFSRTYLFSGLKKKFGRTRRRTLDRKVTSNPLHKTRRSFLKTNTLLSFIQRRLHLELLPLSEVALVRTSGAVNAEACVPLMRRHSLVGWGDPRCTVPTPEQPWLAKSLHAEHDTLHYSLLDTTVDYVPYPIGEGPTGETIDELLEQIVEQTARLYESRFVNFIFLSGRVPSTELTATTFSTKILKWAVAGASLGRTSKLVRRYKLPNLLPSKQFIKSRTGAKALAIRLIDLSTGQSTINSVNYQTGVTLGRSFITPRIYPLFTLHTSSFFIVSKPLAFFDKYLRFKYVLKKAYFSFLEQNQVKKTIMMQRKRIIISRLALNLRRYGKTKARFTYLYFRNNFKLTSRLHNYYKAKEAGTLSTQDLFNLGDAVNDPCSTPLQNFYHSTRDEIVNNDGFFNRGSSTRLRYGEVRVRRIKFKPGYQRIWRRVRLALKDSLRLRFIYQKQLTNYLSKFLNSANLYAISHTEMSFDKLVVYSRLLPDMNTFRVFMETKSIYLNGLLAYEDKGYTSPGDIIQIAVSIWYYILSRWMFNWTSRRTRKFRRMVFRKGLASRYKVMKTRKQHSRYTPNWVYNNRFEISDIKPYIEVDYFSISAVVLYDPYIMDSHYATEQADTRTNIYRLYNWKYIN